MPPALNSEPDNADPSSFLTAVAAKMVTELTWTNKVVAPVLALLASKVISQPVSITVVVIPAG
jgi:hypothetical protein